MDEYIIEFFTLPFLRNALFATLFIGVLCSILGIYIVLKRMVFFSAALAQIATAGLALAFLLGLNPTISSFGLTIIAILIFSRNPSWGKIPLDSILGIGYIGAFALSILFMAKSAVGLEELHHLLEGNILTVNINQVYISLVLLLSIGLIHLIFKKEFLFISYDPEMARTQGYQVQWWNFFLYFTMGMVISYGIRISGVLLIFAMLVMPAVLALQISKKIKWTFIISIVVNIISIVSGLFISFYFDLPSGPAIITVLLGVLLGGSLFRTFTR
jgi:ABC-type Mn2+/Zn2+ transport system permease subunit